MSSWQRQLLGLAAVTAAQLALPQAAIAASPLTPLPAEHLAALQAIPADPAPTELCNDQHHLTSDEHRPDLFRSALSDLGGLHVGVGADQNYFFAGWGKPEVLVLLDFDQLVVDLHGAYRVFFVHASDPQAFLDYWSEPGEPRAEQLFARAISSSSERARVENAYGMGRRYIHSRLTQLRNSFRGAGVPTFLTDQSQYDYVASLYRNHRVIAVRGDLTADKAVRGVARAARRIGQPVRMFYLSNVEMYVTYDGGLRDNMLALPFDDRSLVLRTNFNAAKRERYDYYVQTAADFQAWLRQPDVRRLADIMNRSPKRRNGGAVQLLGPR